MPDPVVIALIAGVSAIIGGVIGGLLRPWGEDWVARRAEERAAARARAAEERRRLERVVQLLGMISVEGPHTSTAEQQEREFPAAVYTVNDPQLSDAMEHMERSSRSTQEWATGRSDVNKRVGELLSNRF